MARKSQLVSPGFTLKPAAPLEVVRKGMEIVEADLTARLSRQRNEDAKSAGVRKKLAQAQLEVLSKCGVDVGALARELWQLRRQRAPKQALPELLQSKVSEGLAVPGYSAVTPPYSWGWSPPGNYVDYAPSPPAILTNYADPETGTLGFDDNSNIGTQVNISNVQAAVGIYFKPEHFGLLYVQSTVVIHEIYGYTTWWTGANARGWAGFLVQGYDAANSLVETPVYQQYILYDEGSNGSFEGSYESKNNLVNLTFTTPWFSVSPHTWYAVWFWCGGDIHAEGQNESGAPPISSSCAYSQMDVSVPSFMLHFRSTKPPLAKPKAKSKTTKAKAAKAKPKAATKKSGRRR